MISTTNSSLKTQLLSMEFEQYLIDQALKQTDNLEKAIEIIISIIEEGDSKQESSSDSIVLLLLVRMDLKMGLGKAAAQCAHATLRAYQTARSKAYNDEKYSLTFIKWLQNRQQKIAYRVQNEEELFDLINKFKTMGIETCYIRDAGRTQIAAGSATVGAIGPYSQKQMELLTKGLSKY